MTEYDISIEGEDLSFKRKITPGQEANEIEMCWNGAIMCTSAENLAKAAIAAMGDAAIRKDDAPIDILGAAHRISCLDNTIFKNTAENCLTNEVLCNVPEELRGHWERLRPYINATPELISLLYDLDLMPEQIHVKHNFFRMLVLADWFKAYTTQKRECGETQGNDCPYSQADLESMLNGCIYLIGGRIDDKINAIIPNWKTIRVLLQWLVKAKREETRANLFPPPLSTVAVTEKKE